MEILSEGNHDCQVFLRFVDGGCEIFPVAQDSEEQADAMRQVDHWALKRAAALLNSINAPVIEATLLAHVLRDETGQAARTLLELAGGYQWASMEARTLVADLRDWQASHADGGPIGWLLAHWRGRPDPYRRFVHRFRSDETVPLTADFPRVIRDCFRRLRGDKRAAA